MTSKDPFRDYARDLKMDFTYYRVCHDYPPVRDPNDQLYGKWSLSKMEFSDEKFPDYCLGITYFMNKATTWKLFRTFEETLKNHYIWIEDVYLTGEMLEIT